MASVLVVDDDRSVVHMLQTRLDQMAVDVRPANSAEEALQMLDAASPDLVLLDYILPEMTGLEALRAIRRSHPQLPVIFMTGRGTSDTAIEAMKLGAHDYLYKPLDLEKVGQTVRQVLDASAALTTANTAGEIRPTDHGNGLVGRSPQMEEVFKAIGRVATQNVSVLIRGESGTGKELVAEAIVGHSRRAAAPFVTVNCAAISESLLESELFGFEKGAFTGANAQRRGKFEQCSGGTLFLDEVGDMSPSLQAKVLRVLQEQRFERVGGNETIMTDVRIIAATNRDLELMCQRATFRNDLFYRLNGYSISVPPLRERTGDIQLLLEHFLFRFNQRLSKNVTAISSNAARLLIEYAWPGNVRELQMVLSRAMLDATGNVITPRALPDSLVRGPGDTPFSNGGFRTEQDEVEPPECDLRPFLDHLVHLGAEDIYASATEFMDRFVLTYILRLVDGNQTKAAQMLGITRGSLRFKLRTLGISIDRTVRSDGHLVHGSS